MIVEATGGLELTLVAALSGASLPVAVVNPRGVRDFAKSTGQLAKNDRPDAQVLAHFGEAVHPPMRPLRDADTQLLGGDAGPSAPGVRYLGGRDDRLGRALREVRPRIEAHIAWLEQELSELDGELGQTILSSPAQRSRQGKPGVHDIVGRPT